MARQTIVALVFVAALVVSCSASHRKLTQDGLYNCGGAKQLEDKCCQLCWCIGNQSDNKSLAPDAIQNYCKQQCSACVAAAKDSSKCPSDGSSLPEVCVKGLQYSSTIKDLTNKCINMYFQDASALSRAQGC